MRLGIKPAEVLEIQKHATSRFVSLENVLQDKGDTSGARFEPADQDERSDPARAAEHQAALTQLQAAIGRLSDRDRDILRLRYGQSKPFHEVGRLLGLSESRVCQLHKRILKSLRLQLSASLDEAA